MNTFFFQNDDEPLNSEDDVSDANSDNEGGDFETEDTIVCQWEKVGHGLCSRGAEVIREVSLFQVLLCTCSYL